MTHVQACMCEVLRLDLQQLSSTTRLGAVLWATLTGHSCARQVLAAGNDYVLSQPSTGVHDEGPTHD
jgi:hypothetical protein